MRLAVSKASWVARLAGITEDAVLGGLVRLWAECEASSTDEVSDDVLHAVFGARIAEELCEHGFIASSGNGFLVLGAKVAAPTMKLAERAAAKAATKHDGNARHTPMVAALCRAFEAERGAPYVFAGRDAKALSDLLRLCDSDEEIVARWRRGLGEQYKNRCDTISDLAKNWNGLTTTGEIKKGVARADTIDWTHERGGLVTNF